MKRKRRRQAQRMSLDTFHQADFIRVVNLLMEAPGRIGQAVRMASEGIAWRLSCAEQAAEWGRASFVQRLSVLVDAAQRMSHDVSGEDRNDAGRWTSGGGSDDDDEEDTERKPMTWDRAKEIGTHGACGELAAAIMRRVGGKPLLRYDKEGTAVHAAVDLGDGNPTHLGDNDSRLVPVSMEEFERACKEDFYPDRANLDDGEIEGVVDLMFPDSVPDESEETSQRMGDVNPWTPYHGSKGGTGWQHSGTGDIRYQTDRPGAHETGGDSDEPKRQQAPLNASTSAPAVSEIEDWPETDERRGVALDALEAIQDGGIPISLRDNGSLSGIASLRFNGESEDPAVDGWWKNTLVVDLMATKQPGYGRPLMREIAEQASAKGCGVTVASAAASKGFYEKLGMRVVSAGRSTIFHWTPQEAAEFAREHEKPIGANETHAIAYQQGQKGAADALLKANGGLIYSLAKRYARHPDDMDDLQQEARIALLDAAKAFDPSKGFQFSTLATRIISNRLWKVAQRSGKRQSVWNQNPEDKEGNQAEPSIDPDELPMEQDEQKAAVLDAIDQLPDRFKVIVQRRYGLDGKPPESSTEIAAKIGLSKQRVSQMLQYAEDKMRGGLKEWATRLSADANPWMPYHGPRGGIGWKHGGTGDVRYGGERPGAHETGGEEPAETSGKAPAAQRMPAESVDQLEKRLIGQYQDDIEDLSLSQPHGKSVHIHNIRMKPGRTGKGVGSKIVRAIQEYAAANDLPITLNSEPDPKKKAALESFYHANGFQRPGRARDYSLTQHTHVWRPRFGMVETAPDEHDRRALHPSKLKVPDKLPGGRADGMPDSDFDPDALTAGTREEMEHTDDPAIAKEIAKDGLVDDPGMYDHDRRAVHPGKLKGGNTTGTQGKSREHKGSQGHVTESPEFKRWFAGSKVVDESGQPLLVHHGGPPKESFDPEHGTKRGGEYGIFLSAKRKYAEAYGNGTASSYYVSMKNPLIVEGKYEISPRNLTKQDIDKLTSEGHDGIVVVNYQDPDKKLGADPIWKAGEIVAFRADQVKPANPDIRMGTT